MHLHDLKIQQHNTFSQSPSLFPITTREGVEAKTTRNPFFPYLNRQTH